ncbi:MAG: alkaline shock response membrane anchor protein AmaP [Fastidiosipilaceae bacterium]|jgi:hypothetical protein
MRKRIRFILFLFSLVVSLTAVLVGWQIVNPVAGATLLLMVQRIGENPGAKAAAISICVIFLVSGIFMMTYALMSDRMRKTRVREGETGNVDIGIDAIESIALNSAKLAQAGVKTAKARIYPAKNNAIRVSLSVILYSDVEIPAQMAIVQDRIKKDVERYTGIPVASVEVKVTRVELVGAKIEH